MGGGVALQLAIRHPALVRKLVVASAVVHQRRRCTRWRSRCSRRSRPSCSPGRRSRRPIAEHAPNPGDFPKLVEKLKRLDTTAFAWPADDIRAITAPTLIILGDSDGVRLEHAVELFGLLGGGVMGDLAGLPKSQLAVLPGTTHFVPPGSGAPRSRGLAAGDDPAVPRRVRRTSSRPARRVRAEYRAARAGRVPDAAGAVLHRAARPCGAVRRRPAFPAQFHALPDADGGDGTHAPSRAAPARSRARDHPRLGPREQAVGYAVTPTASPHAGRRPRAAPYLSELGVTYLHLSLLRRARRPTTAATRWPTRRRRAGAGHVDDLRALAGDLHAHGIALCVASSLTTRRASPRGRGTAEYYLPFLDRSEPTSTSARCPRSSPTWPLQLLAGSARCGV